MTLVFHEILDFLTLFWRFLVSGSKAIKGQVYVGMCARAPFLYVRRHLETVAAHLFMLIDV